MSTKQAKESIEIKCVFCPDTIFVPVYIPTDKNLPVLPQYFEKRSGLSGRDPFLGFYIFKENGFGVQLYNPEYNPKLPERPIVPRLGLGKGLVFWLCDHCKDLLNHDLENIWSEIITCNQKYVEFRIRGAN
ncbi:hypothetical protein HZC21_00375 [Candidatus Peregrinibacteria bacterium]|nr:hypothetical protein [Candidatus Peregrinibacteria bacterium]MBI5732694.1 hypothetical protein [Candidatus Jorgensenbacteria bacterium]